jgi:hypothetical protein
MDIFLSDWHDVYCCLPSRMHNGFWLHVQIYLSDLLLLFRLTFFLIFCFPAYLGCGSVSVLRWVIVVLANAEQRNRDGIPKFTQHEPIALIRADLPFAGQELSSVEVRPGSVPVATLAHVAPDSHRDGPAKCCRAVFRACGGTVV